MSTPPNSEEFYEKLKGQLHETASWPAEYLYKFIVKTDNKKIAKLEAIFDNFFSLRPTKNETQNKEVSQ